MAWCYIFYHNAILGALKIEYTGGYDYIIFGIHFFLNFCEAIIAFSDKTMFSENSSGDWNYI